MQPMGTQQFTQSQPAKKLGQSELDDLLGWKYIIYLLKFYQKSRHKATETWVSLDQRNVPCSTCIIILVICEINSTVKPCL
jgi:hypothetical protein